MEAAPQTIAHLQAEIDRLKWRIGTLETAEVECARAVTALHLSESRYRKLLDEAGFPITISSATDGTILFANPLACSLFGLEGPAPAGRRIVEFYPNPTARMALVDSLRATGEARSVEMVMRAADGGLRVLIVTASLIAFDGQEAVLATSNDITGRKHAEALFQSMVETSPDGIGVSDLDGRLTYVSPRTVQMFGHASAEGMLGRDIRSFVSPDHLAQAERHVGMAQQGRLPGLTEWAAVRLDGSTFPLESNGEILRHPDGSPASVFFTLRDITHRKRLERAARWGEKLESLGLMAAGIARELNNAFQVTWSYLELAQGLGGASGPLAETLGKVGQGIERGTALSAEMLNYSGQSHRQERGMDLGAVAGECLAYWQHCLDPKVSLELKAGEGLPRVVGDEGQITKVIGALILNAVEAMEGEPGTVRVSTRLLELGEAELRTGFWPASGPAGPYLCLELQDYGTGIQEAILEKICDPFFTTKGAGRGLGLSAALGIIRAHSGCLRIVSAPPRGTTVQVCFPVSSRPHPDPALTAPPWPHGKGILVAEDDETIRDLVMSMLPKWGFGPVFGAADGAEAVDLFKAHASSIGLVLTDATMPKMTGPQAFQAMQEISPGVRGILMTGYSETLGRSTAASFGFVGFLSKPFKFIDLRTLLEAVGQGG